MDAAIGEAALNFDEPEHVRMLRETVRRFVEAEMPRAKAREWDRGNIYPAETMKKLGAMGMMGLTVEEQYGGAGVDIYATMAVIEEIALARRPVITMATSHSPFLSAPEDLAGHLDGLAG